MLMLMLALTLVPIPTLRPILALALVLTIQVIRLLIQLLRLYHECRLLESSDAIRPHLAADKG